MLIEIIIFLGNIVFCLIAQSNNCQREITEVFDQNNIQYTCSNKVVFITNLDEVEFSLDLSFQSIDTSIDISTLKKVTITKLILNNTSISNSIDFLRIKNTTNVFIGDFQLVNSTYSKNDIYLNFIQNVEINSILLRDSPLSSGLSISADSIQVKQIDLDFNHIIFKGAKQLQIQTIYLSRGNLRKSGNFFIQFISSNTQIHQIEVSDDDHPKEINSDNSTMSFTFQNIQDQKTPQYFSINNIKTTLGSVNQMRKYKFNFLYPQISEIFVEINSIDLNYKSPISQISPQLFFSFKNVQSLKLHQITQYDEQQQFTPQFSIEDSNQIYINKYTYHQSKLIFNVLEKIESEPLFSIVNSDLVQLNSIDFFDSLIGFTFAYISSSNYTSISNIHLQNCTIINYYYFIGVKQGQELQISNIEINETLFAKSLINIQQMQLLVQIKNFKFSHLTKQFDPQLLYLIRGDSESDGSQSYKYLLYGEGIVDYTQTNFDVNLESMQMGFLKLEQFATARIIDTKINGGYSQFEGGCISFYTGQGANSFDNLNQFELINSQFYNCQSLHLGGGIYGGVLSYAFESVFYNCSSRIGGGLYLSNLSNKQYLENEIIFSKNKALAYGDNYSFELDGIVLEKVYSYSPSLMNTPLYLKEIEPNYKTQPQYNTLFGVMYVLQFNYIINNKTILSNQTSLSLNLKQYEQYSDYSFLTLQIPEIKFPYLVVTQEESSDQNKKAKNVGIFLLKQYSIPLQLITQEGCYEGMENLIIYPSQENICKYCDVTKANYFTNKQEGNSQTKPSQSCQTCNLNSFSMCYGNTTILREGFWRSVYTVDKSEIYSCNFASQNCQGGSGIQDQLCYEGHVGPQCLDCDLYGKYWNESYSRFGSFQCTQCSQISDNAIKLVFLLLIIYLSIIMIILNNFKNLVNHLRSIYLSKLGLIYIGNSLSKRALMSVYIKILIFNFQIYYLSNSFSGVDFMSTLRQFSFTMSNPINSKFFSLNCLLKDFTQGTINIGLLNILLYVSLPTCLVMMVVIALMIGYLFFKVKMKQIQYAFILTLQYTFIILFNSTILEICLQSFVCLKLQNNKSYSLVDLSVECGSESIQQIQMLSIPIFICINILSPIYLFGSLFLKRKKLYSVKVMLTYGFLYKEYKQKYFFWESIRFIVKTLLLCLSIALRQYPLAFCLIITMILLVYTISVQKCQPFNYKKLNNIEIVSILISILNLMSSIVLEEYSLKQKEVIKFVELQFDFAFILSLSFIVVLVVIIILTFFENFITKLANKYNIKFLQRWRTKNNTRIQANFKKLRNCVRRVRLLASKYTIQLASFNSSEDEQIAELTNS